MLLHQVLDQGFFAELSSHFVARMQTLLRACFRIRRGRSAAPRKVNIDVVFVAPDTPGIPFKDIVLEPEAGQQGRRDAEHPCPEGNCHGAAEPAKH